MTKRVRVSAIYYFDINIDEKDCIGRSDDSIYDEICDRAYEKMAEDIDNYEDFDVEVMDW